MDIQREKMNLHNSARIVIGSLKEDISLMEVINMEKEPDKTFRDIPHTIHTFDESIPRLREHVENLKEYVHEHNSTCNIGTCPKCCSVRHPLDLDTSTAWTAALLLDDLVRTLRFFKTTEGVELALNFLTQSNPTTEWTESDNIIFLTEIRIQDYCISTKYLMLNALRTVVDRHSKKYRELLYLLWDAFSDVHDISGLLSKYLVEWCR